MSGIGYRFGLRQPTIHLNVRYVVPISLSLALLDKWIWEALESEVDSYQPVFSTEIDQSSLPVVYLKRLLFVTNILCQDVRIPLFERSVIFKVSPIEKSNLVFTADLWFPIVDGFDPKICVRWFEITQLFVREVVDSLSSDGLLEPVYDRFQVNHVEPWLKKIAGGKSTIPIVQGAFELGIPFSYYGSGSYVLGWGSGSLMFDRSSNADDSAIGSRVTHHKGAAIQMMKKAGIPVPRGVVCRVSSFSPKVVNSLQFPLVVKPVDRDRGEGVTIGVCDEGAVSIALAEVKKYSDTALIEELVPGTCHRILIVKGEVVFVVKRNPRSILGDGVHSIVDLVDFANKLIRSKLPQKRLPEYVLDNLAMQALADQGFEPVSVPVAGQRVFLRLAQSTQWGGDPEEVTGTIHPENAEIAIRAARLFGLTCAGIDLITPDISKPWYENGAAINEVNYSPVLGRTHHYQRAGVRSYLQKVLPEAGKIPIEVFVGENLQWLVAARQRAYVSEGRPCFVSYPQQLVNEHLMTVHMAREVPQPEQIGMLQTNRAVAALLVLVDDPAEFLRLGLPFDYITRLVIGDSALLTAQQVQFVSLVKAYLPLAVPVESDYAE